MFASRYSPRKPRARRDVGAGQPCVRHVSSTQISVDRFRSSFAAVFHCGLCSASFAATATNAHHNVETGTMLYYISFEERTNLPHDVIVVALVSWPTVALHFLVFKMESLKSNDKKILFTFQGFLSTVSKRSVVATFLVLMPVLSRRS